jgi:hypothetical protein
MALIKCPECNKQVSNAAKTCPHCGFQLISNDITKKPKKVNGCLSILIIAASVLTIFFIIGFFGDDSSSDSTNSTNNFLAYNYAEDFVKQKLKSPSTAIFPGISEKNEHIIDLGSGKYKINSWVDSQNGFGAMLRTNFSCTIIFEGEKVRCEDLVLLE